jgi:hypothetical protein
VLPHAHWVDLLLDRDLVRLTREPARFAQEICHEVLVKRLDSFTRFLEVAALGAGKVVG